ncbi:MAG: ABC transporter permease subunit, partial [Proteobacteria bacterium]|nr:ABC transporter permease subunit [Pseudomonadota bacterium]
MFGSRIALMVGAVASGIGVGAGLILGLISGYFGGKMDLIISRVVDTLMAFPALILALLIISILDTGTTTAMIAIGIIFMPLVARVVRSA